MAQDLLDKQLVEAVLSARPRRTKMEIEEARLASKRPARPGAAVVGRGRRSTTKTTRMSRRISGSGRRPRGWSTARGGRRGRRGRRG